MERKRKKEKKLKRNIQEISRESDGEGAKA